jgi:hypothetical protein
MALNFFGVFRSGKTRCAAVFRLEVGIQLAE